MFVNRSRVQKALFHAQQHESSHAALMDATKPENLTITDPIKGQSQLLPPIDLRDDQQTLTVNAKELTTSVVNVSNAHNDLVTTPSFQTDWQSDLHRILAKLRTARVASWEYAIEQAMKVTNDRVKAEAYLKQLRDDGQFSERPDGYWSAVTA
jgi:hypothetical protein